MCAGDSSAVQMTLDLGGTVIIFWKKDSYE